jgi:hypothetical protein
MTIPKNVTDISGDVFYGCTGLEEIYVEEGNTKFTTDENNKILLFNYNDVKYIELGANNSVIPEDNSITKILSGAFSHRTFNNPIIVPSNITDIREYAFAHTNVSSIDCSNITITLENATFDNCTASSIKLPNSITSIP